MKLMHILAHVLPKTRFIDFEYLHFIDTCTTENFNCIFIKTIKVEVIWFLHGTLQLVLFTIRIQDNACTLPD